ncbi:MAG: hypothetical protein N4A54_12740 [Peptostreptococcaceae bacterium]|nr:hypothetical protein [Peptostreptococcaceae bacterium]
MKKNDILWIVTLIGIVTFLLYPKTHDVFINFTKASPYISGFIKFFILATMGELLARRISLSNWEIPQGILKRAFIWGIIGMMIVLVFNIFASGIKATLDKNLLPFRNSNLAFAFFTSSIMNMTFAPVMMAGHRITDTYIDLSYENKSTKLNNILNNIDWNGFISFVILKTIPFFWIPAHTITFLLPSEYRVIMAAMLSIALGAILAFAKKKKD